ncbi:hypothetical protein RhiirC2_779109 [Rhizophagus irregularis]|uniref:Serine-threonine/tyrosine-protein kinase catalytic domain-containing protein n=1 Tax=Rhizophagus irregularis TaxID=588596 RepID=A0A2N1NAL9_9GLOM|nr:hypothetical protein RhiirC2_779109 [Rhizophagus irregularis]
MPSQKRQKQLRRQRIIRSHFRLNLENTSRLIANLSQQQRNNDIDELICCTQLKLSKFRFIQLRWIWDDGAQEWTRAGPMNVALKLLDNSQNISKHITNLQSALLAGMFGITKDPTSSYMIVMKYYENGNLYQYLDHCNEIILGEIEIWSICYGESLEVLKESIPRENSRKSSRRKLTCRTDEKVSTGARIADIGLHGTCNNDINNEVWIILNYDDPNISDNVGKRDGE